MTDTITHRFLCCGSCHRDAVWDEDVKAFVLVHTDDCPQFAANLAGMTDDVVGSDG